MPDFLSRLTRAAAPRARKLAAVAWGAPSRVRAVAVAMLLSAILPAAWAQEPADPTGPGWSEREFTVGEGRLSLPGTLSMPKGAGPFPAVVLVHGSGPSDRDGTVGPNHPLRDIAQGLAERGVAVLRYDKRTRVHPFAFAADPDAGVDEESTHDAVAAVAALQATPGIDPGRVFVFGHSLGAMLTPRIVARAEGASGGVLYAASARRMLDLLPEQVARQGELQGADTAATAAALERINEAVARLRAGEVFDTTPVLGAPAGYFRSTEELDPVAEARAVRQPLLILHGGRDLQVTETDWQAWDAAFADDPRVTLKRYPELGHLGITANAGSPMATYFTPGHVDEALIEDVAAWVTDFTPPVAPADATPARAMRQEEVATQGERW